MSEGFDSVEELWEKLAPELLTYASVLAGPTDSEDVLAEVMTRLLTGEPSNLEGGVFTKAYVRRAVLNEVRMRFRTRSRRESREWAVAQAGLPDHVELLRDPAVLDAMKALSVMQRAVVFFTYWLDLAPDAIGAELGVSSGSVKRHLARGRRKLREVL